METLSGTVISFLAACAALASCGGESRSLPGAAGRSSAAEAGGKGAPGGASGAFTDGRAGHDGASIGGRAAPEAGRSATAGRSGSSPSGGASSTAGDNPTAPGGRSTTGGDGPTPSGGRSTTGGDGPVASGGEGLGEGGEPAGPPSGCSYDSRAHTNDEEFLAMDGCNRCRCADGLAQCTTETCEPDCTVAPIGRLCVVGDWDGGPTASLDVGTPFTLQIEPAGCISGFCNDPLIQTCAIQSQATGQDFTATASFCTHFVDRMACSDCGAFSALCSGEPLSAGIHTVTLEGTDLSVTFEVPSVFPPLAHCSELAP